MNEKNIEKCLMIGKCSMLNGSTLKPLNGGIFKITSPWPLALGAAYFENVPTLRVYLTHEWHPFHWLGPLRKRHCDATKNGPQLWYP